MQMRRWLIATFLCLQYNLGGLPPPVPALPLAAAARSGGPSTRKGASAGGSLVVIGQSSPRGGSTASPRGVTPRGGTPVSSVGGHTGEFHWGMQVTASIF